MPDIVLDTCTLKHASYSENDFFDASNALINLLLDNDTKICVDTGFSLDESINKSYIGHEYIKHLRPGTPGYNLIVRCALSKRFVFVDLKVNPKVRKYIVRVIKNKKDRAFLKVSYQSSNKKLVSHDFSDYTIKKRLDIESQIGVDIVTANEYMEALLLS